MYPSSHAPFAPEPAAPPELASHRPSYPNDSAVRPPGATTGPLRFWRPLPRDAADLVCGQGVVASLPLHMHDAVRVIVPASRVAVVDGQGRAALLRPGLVHWAAPLELHSVRGVDGAPCALTVLLLSPELLTIADQAPDRRTLPSGASPRSGVVDDPGLYARLRATLDLLRGPLVPVVCVGQLRQCVAALLAQRDDARHPCAFPGGRTHAGVLRVRAYLRKHLEQSVSLDELAAVAGLSKCHLLRAFAREHGVTPHAYQMLLRVARAWRLIGEGVPISRVTYDTGFADQSHLTRRFAEQHGVTPGRWAKLLAVPPDSPLEGEPGLGRITARLPAA